MVIGIDKLLPLIRKNKVIKGLSERELENPEGAGFDLRLGELYIPTSEGFLGINDRETSDIKPIAKYQPDKPETVRLKSGHYYLAKTVEKIALEPNMLGFFHPRSTLFRSGVSLFSGVQAPGYSGRPTFGLFIAGPFDFEIQMGARFAHINILEIEGKGRPYRGQWQGGRVTTDGREDQI